MSLHLASTLFFFSSRRRHTRSKRDWSSDVCSSDLSDADEFFRLADALVAKNIDGLDGITATDLRIAKQLADSAEIGRASCRERVQIMVGEELKITKDDFDIERLLADDSQLAIQVIL